MKIIREREDKKFLNTFFLVPFTVYNYLYVILTSTIISVFYENS